LAQPLVEGYKLKSDVKAELAGLNARLGASSTVNYLKILLELGRMELRLPEARVKAKN